MLKINEIFYSIQGESSLNGFPCIFIRLTYCNLRCSYCDTEDSFYEGQDMSIDEIGDVHYRYGRDNKREQPKISSSLRKFT